MAYIRQFAETADAVSITLSYPYVMKHCCGEDKIAVCVKFGPCIYNSRRILCDTAAVFTKNIPKPACFGIEKVYYSFVVNHRFGVRLSKKTQVLHVCDMLSANKRTFLFLRQLVFLVNLSTR